MWRLSGCWYIVAGDATATDTAADGVVLVGNSREIQPLTNHYIKRNEWDSIILILSLEVAGDDVADQTSGTSICFWGVRMTLKRFNFQKHHYLTRWRTKDFRLGLQRDKSVHSRQE